MNNKCGEDSYGFYDKKGDYFREGVDPRNHVGRHFLPEGFVCIIPAPQRKFAGWKVLLRQKIVRWLNA